MRIPTILSFKFTSQTRKEVEYDALVARWKTKGDPLHQIPLGLLGRMLMKIMA